MMLQDSAIYLAAVVSVLLSVAGFLHLLPKLGKVGGSIGAKLQHAPGLDVMVTIFTVLPWLVGAILYGWTGFFAGLVGQVVTLQIWCILHELAHRSVVKGPRILKVLNSRVGRFRNHLAVWITTLAVPVFWLARLTEWIVYPPLVLLVRFPSYNQKEWVNISRQKFEGLVGWDLIWCLYCDWMTGIWSLGTEMLRNVESFWCPIRFDSTKKCENCKIDFPDLENGWVPADGNIADVADRLAEKYTDDPAQTYAWFGHESRKPCDGGAGCCDSKGCGK